MGFASDLGGLRALGEGDFAQRQLPDAVEPAPLALNAAVVPVAAGLPGAEEHQIEADGVGAEAFDPLVGVDDVAAALGHLVSVFGDRALIEESGERLVDRQVAHIARGLGEEAGVEQVHDGVLRAAGVLVDRQPAFGQLGADRRVVVVRIDVAVHVPVGAHEGVHGVGLAPRRAAAPGAVGVQEALVALQRRCAGGQEFGVVGQQHGQLGFGDRHDSAVVAVDYRDRRAPVALAADQPVAQAIGDGLAAEITLGERRRDGALAVLRGRAVESVGVDHQAVAGVGLRERLAVPVGRRDHDGDRQLVLAGKGEVTLIVGGDAHHGAGAVAEQHVVGDPDWDRLVGERVSDVGAGEDAGLFEFGGLALDLGLSAGLRDISVDRFALPVGRQPVDQRVFRGEHEVADAEDGVGAGGEDGDAVDIAEIAGGVVEREGDFRAFGAADPVALHHLDRFGPVDGAEVEQLVGVVGDAEEPLLEVARLDDRAAAFAGTRSSVVAQHLLVGQYGAAGWAPVGGGASAVGEAVAVELEEPPLGPAVVLRIGGGELAIPVEAGAHLLELAAHRLDVAVGPLFGVGAVLDRGVFGGQAECVEAEREEHVVALHALPAGGGVAGGHRVPVPDVQIAAGVGEHGQEEVGGAVVLVGGAVEAVDLPAPPPARLDLAGVVVGQGLRGGRCRC